MNFWVFWSFPNEPWPDVSVADDRSFHSLIVHWADLSRFSHYKRESFNVQPRHVCLRFSNNVRMYSRWNNRSACEQNGGRWAELHNYLEKAPGQ